MTKWIVYNQDGQASSPLSSAQVRDMLRLGQIDAFDLVSALGSSEKNQLVDIDEIFSPENSLVEDVGVLQEGTTVGSDIQKVPRSPAPLRAESFKAEGEPAPPNLLKGVVGPPAPKSISVERPGLLKKVADSKEQTVQVIAKAPVQANSLQKTIDPWSEVPASRGPLQVQGPELYDLKSLGAVTVDRKPGRDTQDQRSPFQPTLDELSRRPRFKRKGRRYMLYDKGRKPLGPLTASEVQSLFARGMLEKTVKVSKDGGAQNIPIQQFVGAYTTERSKLARKERAGGDFELTRKNKGGLPSSKILDEMVRSQIIKTSKEPAIPFVLISSVLVFLGVLSWGIYLLSSDHELRAGIVDFFTPQQTYIDLEEVLQPNQGRSEQTRPVKSERPARVAKRSDSENVEQKEAPKKEVSRKEPSKTESFSEKVNPQVTEAPKKLSEKIIEKKVEPPKFSTPLPPARPAPVAKLVPKPPPPIAPPPLTPSLSSLVGLTVTLSGLSYSMKDLAACELKCSLVLKDGSGAPLTARFFKGAYEDLLKAGNGRISIQGRIAKEGSLFVIYPQSMRS